ncbi:MAG: excinuclease ABC subunit UvrA, partial [Planctomycetales bacterium]|nr:excinuclease ABC subunit UvrA [Planctomycetales bacterium]
IQKGARLSTGHIELRGVAVHNLQEVDLDIPHHQLVVVCGVSGSGKTSIALDTLYAEGQRRYIESFSAYTRQFLERLDKPAAERIDNIPPAIAVTHKNVSRSSRATVGTATEVLDYLRLLFARVGQVHCPQCGRLIRRDSAESAASVMAELPAGVRFQVAYPLAFENREDLERIGESLREDGFLRWIVNQRTRRLDEPCDDMGVNGHPDPQVTAWSIVDRLSTGDAAASRIRESFEMALSKGEGRCVALLPAETFQAHESAIASSLGGRPTRCEKIDDSEWVRIGFNDRLTCEDCQLEMPRQEPRLYSFNSPLGACPACEGFGNIMGLDIDLVVPNRNKSLSEGAIAPWNTPAYAHELQELLALAPDYNIPVHVPFRDLEPGHVQLIHDGVPERQFGGLAGFMQWLEKRKYKMHIRVFLSRWRSQQRCQQCAGTRLRPEALATRVGGQTIATFCSQKVREARQVIQQLELPTRDRKIAKMLTDQIASRLKYLEDVGLGYLTLDRTLKTLSSGESQRVSLTAALGSSLVNMLYVLDEPSVGLHPADIGCLLTAIEALRDRGNTVVVVEHDEAIIRSADRVIEIGPGAGEDGGRVMFEGTADEMPDDEMSVTGDFLAGRRGIVVPERRREPNHGWIRLTGARGNNLKGMDVEFPLGVLCLVTGVSGSGKSTLVEQTLYPALCRRKRKDAPPPLACDDVYGDGQLDDVILVDQSPIGRSPRSNPVTYIKAFDAIRNVFAGTLAARTHNYKASHFSFNVDGGRCDTCKGDGHVQIDMQFLADVMMKCSECQGRRYRREILDVTYRNRNISDVLEMTAREAYAFFRGEQKVQSKLHQLLDVGLEYLRLGQAANTLSAGEAQRLKLAGYLSSPRRGRTLFLLDEPTTGLHFADIVQLLDCFDALLNVGHSLIVVEHNSQLMKAADYIIDLGPGASDEGGRVVVQGTPEQVARCPDSATGRLLAEALAVTE